MTHRIPTDWAELPNPPTTPEADAAMQELAAYAEALGLTTCVDRWILELVHQDLRWVITCGDECVIEEPSALEVPDLTRFVLGVTRVRAVLAHMRERLP